MSKRVIVDPKIFDAFPDFKRGLVIVDELENRFQNDRIMGLLDKVIELRRSEVGLLDHPFVKAWDEAHTKFGSNPNRFPPSIKALLKRVQKTGRIPFINNVVAIFNYISIKYLVPCGGDDVDRIEGNLCLGFASGRERFIPLGGTEEEFPEPGEVIYFDDKSLKVMCRRWNWRNGDFSKIVEETKRAVINVDGIGSIPEELVVEARDELANLLAECCAAKVRLALLKRDMKEIVLYE